MVSTRYLLEFKEGISKSKFEVFIIFIERNFHSKLKIKEHFNCENLYCVLSSVDDKVFFVKNIEVNQIINEFFSHKSDSTSSNLMNSQSKISSHSEYRMLT